MDLGSASLSLAKANRSSIEPVLNPVIEGEVRLRAGHTLRFSSITKGDRCNGRSPRVLPRAKRRGLGSGNTRVNVDPLESRVSFVGHCIGQRQSTRFVDGKKLNDNVRRISPSIGVGVVRYPPFVRSQMHGKEPKIPISVENTFKRDDTVEPFGSPQFVGTGIEQVQVPAVYGRMRHHICRVEEFEVVGIWPQEITLIKPNPCEFSFFGTGTDLSVAVKSIAPSLERLPSCGPRPNWTVLSCLTSPSSPPLVGWSDGSYGTLSRSRPLRLVELVLAFRCCGMRPRIGHSNRVFVFREV